MSTNSRERISEFKPRPLIGLAAVVSLVAILSGSTAISATDPPLLGSLRPAPRAPLSAGIRSSNVRPFSRAAKLPLYFEPNLGQAPASIRFLARGSDSSLALFPDGAILALHSRGLNSDGHGSRHTSSPRGTASSTFLRMRLLDANRSVSLAGDQALPGRSNYFIGSDPHQWRTNIPQFGRVHYRRVYPGIDLVYYGNGRQIEHDFLVSPSASPRSIHLRFDDGIGSPAHGSALRITPSGDLSIPTVGGELRLLKPVAYQDVDGKRRSVSSSFVLQGHSSVGFKVASYDHGAPLVIDPVLAVISYSTFIGGSFTDGATGIAIDPATQSIYLTGTTNSDNFPGVGVGSLQQALPGISNAFVMNLDPTGTKILFATFLGGSLTDTATAIGLDGTGSVYITGSTTSSDFPVTNTAFQTKLAGIQNAFVTKLTPSGAALAYSTYLGGEATDEANAIVVDETNEEAYVAGGTTSTAFPLQTPYQNASGGAQDGFLTRLNKAGTGLLASTYFGGSGNDQVNGIALDKTRNVIIVGSTTSSNLPVTSNAPQVTPAGSGDAFVARFSNAATALGYCTYLGGTNADSATAVATDPASNIYVVGSTQSLNFPTSNGAVQTSSGEGFYGFYNNAFLVEIGKSGAFVYGTYLGGSMDNDANAVALDGTGNVYIVGETNSPDFPITNALTLNGNSLLFDNGGQNDTYNAFVAKISPVANVPPFYVSWFGGSVSDNATGIALNAAGTAWITGETSSPDFPISTGALQPTIGGSQNAFLMSVVQGPAPPTNLVATASPPPLGQTQVVLTWQDATNDATSFKIEREVGSGFFNQIDVVPATTLTYTDNDKGQLLIPNTNYTYRVRATNAIGDSPYSNDAGVTTLPTPPAAASGLTATVVSSNEIDLAWTDTTGDQTGFNIERTSGSSGVFAVIATVDAYTTVYQDMSAQPNMAYVYQIVTENSGGDGTPSAHVSATTPPVVPTGPSNLTGQPISGTEILLTWVNNSINNTGFKIQRLDVTGIFQTIGEVGASAPSFLDTGLTPGDTYTYQVFAINTGSTNSGTANESDSAPSNPATVTTFPEAPAAPTNLTAAAASTTEIDLAWTSNSTDETGFMILRESPGTSFTQVDVTAAGLTTYQDTGLTPNTTYTYEVQATNAGGNSGVSNMASATTPLTPPPIPSAPSGLVATIVTATQVNLTWTSNSNNETGFDIQRETSTTGTFTQIGTTGYGVTAYTDSTVTAGSTYSYQVCAANGGGKSAFSNTATISIGADSISGTVTTTVNSAITPLPGITMELLDSTGADVLQSTTTDTNGDYTFSNLVDGPYQVRLVGFLQMQTQSLPVTVAAATNAGAATQNFTTLPPFTVPQGVSMISVPYNYSASSITAATALGTTLIATYDPTLTPPAYRLYSSSNLPGTSGTQTLAGRGYWVSETTPQPFYKAGAPVSSPFQITVSPGWNMIGNPFTTALDTSLLQFEVNFAVGSNAANTPISLQTALTNGIVDSPIWGYSPATGYTESSTLAPFGGYWLYVDPTGSKNSPVIIIFTNPSS